MVLDILLSLYLISLISFDFFLYNMNDLKIFSGRANPGLAKQICDYLGIPQGQLAVGNFPDGETQCKIEQDVRGQDIFIIQPTCPPVNDNLMELLILIESFKRASADRVTAVIPYFGYARQDRKDEGRVPITAKLVANILTRAGADRILSMDLHAAQIQGFFDIPVDHLTAAPVLDNFFRNLGYTEDRVVVVSPDEGSIKRAASHVKSLGGSLAIIDKRRFGNRVEQANLIGGPIEGKIALLFDDMISTGSSICGAAHLVKRNGAEKIYIGATHGVLCGNAIMNLRNAPVENIILTDTIPLPEELLPNLKVLSVAPLLGEAIRRIHCHESVSRLFSDMQLWSGK
ncbi:MAG: ribose-phosphate pyrophosphokinase [Planctomycetaceae bacterium]|jgi:ribose-phosphate pyrophosphokinase|nr:ribose-phosphate pyrophosphokinase [Planctomycetaceae bacterium]